MAFDVESARQAGYSDDDILAHLTQTRKFDIEGARSAGYSNDDLISYLSGQGADASPPPDDLTDTAEPPTKTSTLVHAAERGVAPALTGMAGMGLGAELAAPLAPLAGPLAPVVPIIGALAGGFGAAYLTSEAQDKLLSMLPDSVREYIGQSAAQRAAEGDAHPVVSVAGEMLPQLLTMRPGSTLPLREGANAIERLFAGPVSSRVIGAGLGAGQEAAQEASSDEPMSPARIAASAGVGAALNRPTALGERLEQAGARLVPDARPIPDAAPPPPPDAPPPDAAAPPPEGAPAPGAVVGLRQKDGAPERVVIESVQDGYVFYRDQDNRQRADALDEFQRDLTDAPPARNPDQGDATTVPEPPPDATPPPDLLDEMYAEQAEQAPAAPARAQPPSPQADLPLPETRVVDDLLGQAAAQREAAARVRATKPDDAAFFERSAASLEARAKDLSDRIGAPADTVRDVDLRPVDDDAVRLGPLGEHAREPGEPVPEPVAPPPAGQDTGLGPLGRFARPENGEPPVPERPAAPEPVASPTAPATKRGPVGFAEFKAAMPEPEAKPLTADDPRIQHIADNIDDVHAELERAKSPLAKRLDVIRRELNAANSNADIPALIDDLDGALTMVERNGGKSHAIQRLRDMVDALDETANHADTQALDSHFATRRAYDLYRQRYNEVVNPEPGTVGAKMTREQFLEHLPAWARDADLPEERLAYAHALETLRGAAAEPEPPKEPVDRTYEIAQRRSEAARKARMTRIGNRPLDLAEFVAKNGGIRLDDPNIGDVRQAIGAPQKMVRDFGPLIRRTGKPLDELREMAEEAGYFGNREGTTVSDLVDALDRNLKGERQFAARDQGEVADRAAAAESARAADEFKNTYGADGEGETRFAAQRMKDAGLLDDTLDPMADHPDDLRAAIDERLAMMDAPDIDAALGALDTARDPAISREAQKGTQDDDFDLSALAAGEGTAAAERPAPRGAEPESQPGPEEGSRGGGEPPGEDQRPGGRTGEEGAVEPPTETVDTLDGPREQHVLPGAERTAPVNPEAGRQADITRLESEQSKLRSRAPQESVRDQDGGLFSSDRDQGNLYSGLDPFRAAGEVGRIYRSIADNLKTRAGKSADTEATARSAASVTAAAPPPSLTLRNLSWFGRAFSFPAGLAARDAISARYFARLLERQRAKETIDRDGAQTLQPYYRLSPEAKARVNRVLEYRRIAGEDIRDTGRRVIVRVPDGVKLELSKPGDVIALTRDETDAFHAVRRYADQRLLQFGEAMARQMGYDGEFSPDGIARAQDEATDAGARKAAARAAEIYSAVVEDGRRRGYIPFSRYGNYYIKILPKVAETPGRDATPPRLEDGRFELVETGSPLDFLKSSAMRGTPKQALERLTELRKQYPADKFDYEHGFVSPKAVESLDIPLLDRMVMAVGLQDPDLGAKLYDDVYRQILDERMAGFRKESRNIPGYSTDFERSLSIYNRQSGDVIANMRHGRDIEAAYDETQRHPSRDIRRFWKAHREHLDGPSQDFARIRQFGFLNFLWGSPSSALVNLSQTPLVTANQIAGWAGAKGFGMANGAMIEGLRALRVTPRGVTVDWNAVGKTPAEKAMIAELRKDGTLDPAIALDLQGGDITDSQRLRPYATKMKAVYDAGSSMFNAAEQVNRAAAALSYFRAAQAPGGMDAARKFYAGDALFQEQVGRAISPTAIARYGVDETQFVGGKLNRQPIQRGLGAVLFQFHTYPANYVRLLYKNFGRMGAEGKTAGTLMLMALAGTSGLFGLPFVDDITSAGEAIWKAVTDEDPMIERHFRQALIDVGFDQYGAEALARGPTRSLLGVDLSRRLGMGQIAPNVSGIDAFGPFASATVGRALEIAQRLKSGQPETAAAAAIQTVAGKGPSDLVRAAALKDEGYRTRLGAGKFAPSDITAGEVAAKAVGLNPARFARRSEQEMSDRRAAAADQQSASQFTTNVATALAFAEKERRAGNESGAAEYRAEAQRLMDARAKAGKPVNQGAIRSRVQAILSPKEAAVKRAPKAKRADVLASPYPSE